MAKNVALLVAGTAGGQEQLLDVEVPPGSTAADILRAADLDPRQWLLSEEGSAQVWAMEEPVFDRLTEGGKIRATAKATVGAMS